ncbi:MAG: DUF2330 domain-containing protein [Lentisphaeraceae bacterium]|nr:DUF2330 domain-containing protein [Lentisphaeraceae bacterium]
MNFKKILHFFTLTSAIIVSLACCMLPDSYQGSIQQSSQQGLIVFDNGIEDLILKVSPKISGEQKLKSFCWLITVPNQPDKYRVVNSPIFRKLSYMKIAHLDKEKKEKYSFLKPANEDKQFDAIVIPAGVELGKPVNVGAYDIQPVRGVGKNALSGLNTWLQQNGFPTEPAQHMKYFIDNKFTFLCIKVNPDNQSNDMSRSPSLKPLHLTFKTDKIYYPMKYSSQQGNFSANLYILSTMPVDYKLSDSTLERIDWSNQDLHKNVRLKTSSFHNVEMALDKKLPMDLYFNNFFCDNPNKNKAISQWKEDVFLELNDSHEPNDANRINEKASLTPIILTVISVFLIMCFIIKRTRNIV